MNDSMESAYLEGVKKGDKIYYNEENAEINEIIDSMSKKIIKAVVQGEGSVEGATEEGTRYKIGDEATLKAIPGVRKINGEDYTYLFKGWYLNGELQGKDTTLEITVTNDATYTAIFELEPTLIYYADGTIEVTSESTLKGYAGDTNIVKVEVGSVCTTIGSYAFEGCTGLKEVVILSNTNVGDHAFVNCTKLERIDMPKAVLLGGGVQFKGCTSLKDVVIGSIGNAATSIPATFHGCSQPDLTIKIYVESGTISLPGEPWQAINATIEYYDATTGELVNVSLGQRYKGNTEIDFTEIPNADKITKIKDGAFSGCTNLALTSLPQNVTYIGARAFEKCSNVVITEIPEKCITIGESAFEACRGLREIKILSNTNVEYHAFMNCTNLERIDMPKAVLLGDGVQFKGCTSLKDVVIGSIGNAATSIPATFHGCSQPDLTIKIYVESGTISLPGEPWQAINATIEYYDATTGELVNVSLGQRYKGNTEIDFTEIPNADKITKIKDGAFSGCTNLALTSLPQNLTYIGARAFEKCSNVVITEIPEKCTTIGESAFEGCTGLKEVVILSNTNVGYHAFKNCTNLERINMPKAVLTSEGVQFIGCTSLKDVVIGSIGNATTSIPATFHGCSQSDLTIKIYVESGTTSLPGEPWQATNATIEYYNATTGDQINQ